VEYPKKVRLKPRSSSRKAGASRYFNTKKVRLKLSVDFFSMSRASTFQYQKGAIKTLFTIRH